MIPFDNMVTAQMSHFQFGDKRLNKRCLDCIKQIDEIGSHNSFPRIFKNQHQLKAFYRLMNHPDIEHMDFFKSYQHGLIEQVQQHKSLPDYQRLYLFSDTSFVKYHDRKKLQLGYLETGKDNGLALHSSILTDRNRVPLGVPVQQIIIRNPAHFGKRHDRHNRAFEDKESFKWTSCLDWVEQLSSQTGVEVVQVMDREADIAELYNYAFDRSQFFIVRSRHNRKVEGSDLLLWDHIRQQPLTIEVERQLLNSKGKPHMVNCQIRYAQVQLAEIMQPLWAIHLLATDSPVDIEQTEWFLLTNVPVQSPKDAEHILDVYTNRWRTNEDFHKCLKTGCNIEKRQFDSLKALANVIALLSLVAVRLLRMRHLAQTKGQTHVNQVLAPNEIPVAQLLAKKYLMPIDLTICKPNTVLWWVLLLGRMGGHQGYKQKGMPGWQTIFHGWNYYQTILKGINLSKNFSANPNH